MLKSRDITDYMRNMGTEKGTVYCLQTLAEQQVNIMKRIVELANYFDQIVDSMDRTVDAVGRAKADMERLKKQIDPDDDLPPNTQDLERKN